MNRDEFMELVYETFTDEPDNVLANGIIEAADAYVEHEKVQLSCESATSDMISRTETVEHLRRMLEATVPNTDYDEGYIDGIEFGISTVSTMPTVQPEERTEKRTETHACDLISRKQAIDAKMPAVIDGQAIDVVPVSVIKRLPSVQPEPQEGHWIEVAGELECSECHTVFTDLYPDYADSVACPHCGAKMKGARPK